MKASIDIGTNTVLLLVAEETNGQLKIIHEAQRVPRLGAGVDASENLSKDAINRVVGVLNDYLRILNREFPSVNSIKVTATSAVRDARNRSEFINIIENKTGLGINVLNGFEEAQYTFHGAKSVLYKLDPEKEKVVIDIGGGSTEIAMGRDELMDRYSFDMGCVRFTERFLTADPPSANQLEESRQAVREMLEEFEFNFVDDALLIGVAGTVTSLAFIDKKLKTYQSNKLAGHVMSIQAIRDYSNLFKKQPSQRLAENYPAVMEGRADIFLAGLIILEEFMRKYKFEELITSPGGIRHGVLLGE